MSNETESDVLAREAAAAQAAAIRAIGDLKTSLVHAADPRLWAQQHPWAAVGVAAVAGFAAATLVVPSPEPNVKEKLSDLLKGLNNAQNGHDASSTNGVEDELPEKPSMRSGPLAAVMEAVLDLSKTAVTNFVMAAVHKSSEPPPSDELSDEELADRAQHEQDELHAASAG